MQRIHDQIDQLRAEMRAPIARLESAQGRAQAIMNKCDREKRDCTPEEARQMDTLHAAFDAASAEAREIKVRIEELEATPMPRLTQPDPIASANPGGRTAMRRAAPIGERTAKFNDVFAGRQLVDHYAGRFESFGEFALAVAAGGRDERLIQNSTMRTDEGASAGFLIPLQFLGNILDASLQQEVIRPRAQVIPMTTKQATAGVFDYADGTSGKRAGLQLLWGPEATTLAEQRGLVREVGLVAHKANIFCRVSAELAADAPLFDQQLGAAIVAATAAGLDIAFINGTGAGQPLGIIPAASTITVSKEGSQAANTVLLQNVSKMMARLSPASFARAIWMIHPTVVVPLYTMAVVVQNVAGAENVGGSTASAVTVDANGQLRIFGRPCVVTDACAALSSLGDIILADLSKYLIGQRAEATIKKDESRYFDSDEIAFKMTLRVDGMPADKEATKLKDGTNTTSPFVILQAR